MSRILHRTKELALLAYPAPYKCWLTLSSDPDLTFLDNWREVHSLIWEELSLPFADSLFIINRNEQLPGQVCLAEFPECIGAHPHDTIHTWGDFILSGSYRFTRRDALQAVDLLKQNAITPRVWTDHSNFIGNLRHRAHVSASPTIVDTAGQVYDNDLYTLDLAESAGIRYVWDGILSRGPIGQDRPLNRREWYRESALRHGRTTRSAIAAADFVSTRLAQFRNPKVFNYSRDGNRQYIPHEFPDGTKMYCFRRFGSWRLGDIDGLSEILRPETINRLIKSEGTMILYTHLGKRNNMKATRDSHIPQATGDTLTSLAEHYHAGRINLSSTSKLLDYLVLRDHAELRGNQLHFCPDDIRFPSLGRDDLSGHEFGLRLRSGPIRIVCNDVPIEDYELKRVGADAVLSFP